MRLRHVITRVVSGWYSDTDLLRPVTERWTTGWQLLCQQLHHWIGRDSCLHVLFLRYAEVSMLFYSPLPGKSRI